MSHQNVLPSKLILKNLKSSEAKKNNVGKFVAWFLKSGKGKIVTQMDIAKFLSSIVDRDITDRTVSSFITHGREVLENKKAMSIWNIRGEGYRLATEKEKAIFLVRHTRKTLKYADRATRLYLITDHRMLPDAVKSVFGTKEKARGLIRQYENQLLAICNGQRRIAYAK